MTQVGFPLKLPEKYRKPLEEFSSEEILQGLLDHFKRLDVKTNMTNHQYRDITVVKFNPYLIQDALPLRQMLAKHDQPREFFHLSGLAFALTEARSEDFIPSFFNTLFRDGRVAREQGEYTKNYARDVSVLAYGSIIATLRVFKSDYITTRPEGLSHEEEVDHLAKWLIANWPGCENFTLSDQNVPAILGSRSKKRISRQPSVRNEKIPSSAEKSAFEFSWPLITAIVFLLGSLTYWGKKRFA